MTTPSPSYTPPRSAAAGPSRLGDDCQTPLETGISFEATQALPQAMGILGQIQESPAFIEALLYLLLGNPESPWQIIVTRIIATGKKASASSAAVGRPRLPSHAGPMQSRPSLGENRSPNTPAVRRAHGELVNALAEPDSQPSKKRGVKPGTSRGSYARKPRPVPVPAAAAPAPVVVVALPAPAFDFQTKIIARDGISAATIKYDEGITFVLSDHFIYFDHSLAGLC